MAAQFRCDSIRFAGQSLLGMFAKGFLSGPLGVSLDELGNFGKATSGAGASVVHLDAAEGIVAWARANAQLSGLADAPIRWIVEDVTKFS